MRSNDVARSPYAGLPADRFWKTAVSGHPPGGLVGVYRRRFELRPDEQIATAGSCFAQHIARALRVSGYQVVDTEPPPRGMTPATAERFGYGLYSARFGNIYHVRRLRQLLEEVRGTFKPKDWIWEKDGRYYDALRPAVEPFGLDSPAEVEDHRADHVKRVRAMLRQVTLFVFTLGLTEAWVHTRSGTVFPSAPGTICGTYDPRRFGYVHFDTASVIADVEAVRRLLKSFSPAVRFILTVSPVPLAATAEQRHVLLSTMESKAVLRAACGDLYRRYTDIDYFPSFEIIAGHPSRGAFYDETLRTVTSAGVDTVMAAFFAEHPVRATADQPVRQRRRSGDPTVCEDAILEQFAQ